MATQEEIAPSPRLEAEAKTEKAEADYKVAKQKCDDLSGNAKDVCKKDAKATKVAEEKGPNSAAAMGASKDAKNDTTSNLISQSQAGSVKGRPPGVASMGAGIGIVTARHR